MAYLWLLGSLALNFVAGRFADAAGARANSSPDLLFSLLPFADTSALYTWGALASAVWLIAAALKYERGRLEELAWAFGALIYVRCLSIVLTPMRLPDQAIVVEGGRVHQWVGRWFDFKHDLFFSSHTALPFMGYLMYRDRVVRLSFLAISLVMAATVLLGRRHYSIDVFGAYFVTYAVYSFLASRNRHIGRLDSASSKGLD